MANCTIELYLLIDQDGEFVVHTDESELGNVYEENINSTAPCISKTYKLTLNVPLPQLSELIATLPENGDQFTLTVTKE